MEERVVNRNSEEEIEIDLVEIFGVLMHWIWLILLVGLVFGIIGFVVSKYVLPEEFESTTQVYVLSGATENKDTISNAELQAGTQLTQDYIQMVTSRYVLETVIDHLQLPYDAAELKKKIDVATPANTRMITITVTDHDRQAAQTIANEVRVVASQRIKDVMAIGEINVVDEANYPLKKSAPSTTRNTLIAALLGMILVSAIVILRYLLDDTIKTADDVERYLGVSSLALIPLDDAIYKNSDEAKKKRGLFGGKKSAPHSSQKKKDTAEKSNSVQGHKEKDVKAEEQAAQKPAADPSKEKRIRQEEKKAKTAAVSKTSEHKTSEHKTSKASVPAASTAEPVQEQRKGQENNDDDEFDMEILKEMLNDVD